MIELLCVGGPYNGRRVRVPSTDHKLSVAMIGLMLAGKIADVPDEEVDREVGELPQPTLGEGYYAPQNREVNGRIERVLRWEGEL